MNLKDWSTKILDEGENPRWSVNHSQSLLLIIFMVIRKSSNAAKQSNRSAILWLNLKEEALARSRFFSWLVNPSLYRQSQSLRKCCQGLNKSTIESRLISFCCYRRLNFFEFDLSPTLTRISGSCFWFHEKNIRFVTQCANFMIFLSLGFYVKSIFENPWRAKSVNFTHLEALNFNHHEFLHF